MSQSNRQPVQIGPQPASWTDCLQFLPRPVLLRQLSQTRSSAPEVLSQQLSNLAISFTRTQAVPPPATMSRESHIHSRTGDSCTDTWSRHHDLSCGHIIATKPFNEHSEEKPQCGPNCVRYAMLYSSGIDMAVFERITDRPFVCPVCIGEYVAWYRVDIGMHYQEHGWSIPTSEEEQINLFAYHIVRRCVEHYGMRMSETGDGVRRVRLGQLPAPQFSGAADASGTNAETGNFGTYREVEDEQNRVVMGEGEGAVGLQSFSGDIELGGDSTLDGLTDRLLEVRIGEATDDIIGALLTGFMSLSVA